MFIDFKATESGSSIKEGQFQSVGLSSGNEYLLFSRSPPDHDGYGVYLEYNDQINSGYDCVGDCFVTRKKLKVKLSKQLGSLDKVEGFNVELSISKTEFEELINGLRIMFKNKPENLNVEV